VGEKSSKTFTEIQLGFEFFNDVESSSEPAPGATPPSQARRGRSKSRGLAETLATARVALLDASLTEVSAHLLPLFEFCEAALTRALDVVPTRSGVPFSGEENRSLRGIGQAQWLLTEAHGKKETKSATSQKRKVEGKRRKEKGERRKEK
jgi:hypothetical protein